MPLVQGLPQAPAPPPAVGTPNPNAISTRTLLGSSEIDALRQRGKELANQISSATNRRDAARRDLRSATGADKAGLEQRLGVLDARIADLEKDIAENGRQLSSPEASRAIAGTAAPFGRQNFNGVDRAMIPISIVFTIFVLCPMAVSISRWLWKRGSIPRALPASPDTTKRLERMEQAIDSIAVEMERVSEGQRFVTRILAEGRPAPQALPLKDRASA